MTIQCIVQCVSSFAPTYLEAKQQSLTQLLIQSTAAVIAAEKELCSIEFLTQKESYSTSLDSWSDAEEQTRRLIHQKQQESGPDDPEKRRSIYIASIRGPAHQK